MSKKTISIDEQAFNIGGSPRSRKGRKGGNTSRATSPVNQKYKKELLNKIKKAINKTAVSQEIKTRAGGDIKGSAQSKNSTDIENNETVFDYFTKLRDKNTSRINAKYEDYINSVADNPNPNHAEPSNPNQAVIPAEQSIEIISRPSSRPQSPHHTTTHTENVLKDYTPKPIPYGILKGGVKPTYRTWKKHHHNNQFNATRRKYNEHKSIRKFIENSGHTTNDDINKQKIENIRQLYNTPKTPDALINKSLTTPYTTVKTVKKTFKMKVIPGKNKTTKKISTILSNNSHRSKIKSGITELLNKPIPEIKRYLKEKNIITAGSLAPNVLIRQMYLQNYLCGGGCNINKGVVVENFISS